MCGYSGFPHGFLTPQVRMAQDGKGEENTEGKGEGATNMRPVPGLCRVKKQTFPERACGVPFLRVKFDRKEAAKLKYLLDLIV
jgi:hypothetical protein